MFILRETTEAICVKKKKKKKTKYWKYRKPVCIAIPVDIICSIVWRTSCLIRWHLVCCRWWHRCWFQCCWLCFIFIISESVDQLFNVIGYRWFQINCINFVIITVRLNAFIAVWKASVWAAIEAILALRFEKTKKERKKKKWTKLNTYAYVLKFHLVYDWDEKPFQSNELQ